MQSGFYEGLHCVGEICVLQLGGGGGGGGFTTRGPCMGRER